MAAAPAASLEMWGGVECSVNRVGDRYHNQLDLGGHAGRITDLENIASLGIRTVRYPCLWELLAPQRDPDAADWRWSDARLRRLQELSIEPIVGLLHHGSGPPHTGLLHARFARDFAAYAATFARRYPWVSRYTPVNEPLTTARFSALYGLWYPHHHSGAAFARALVNQCRATVLAMRAIRGVTPSAQLIQTEDIGRVFSTAVLAYQADFENERRWLTWDLLCGRVDCSHALWDYLRACEILPRELDWFRRNPCPPSIIGINHYITSNRYLDDRVELFPGRYRGGNGRHDYADVEAVRMLPHSTLPGWGQVLDETWERYRLPLAITEVHLGCTREEQMRWLYQAWNAATAARTRGCDVRAVTPWALLGSHDWAALLTRFDGQYETGAWDVRAPLPRRTALAGLIADLASGRRPAHESWLRLPGWWQRETRLLDLPQAASDCRDTTGSRHARGARHALPEMAGCHAPLLITGARGTLGRAFARACELRGLPFSLVSRQQMDICDPAAVGRVIGAVRPWAVINAAGYVRVDDAEGDRERCERENSLGARALAVACAAQGMPLVTFSTDLVFDGQISRPYVEADPPCPICVYGETKARAERWVLEHHALALVIRTSSFFGPWDDYNFLTITLRALARGETVLAAKDVTVSPTYVPDLVNTTLDLLLDGECGLWHLTNHGSTTWHQFALAAARQAELPTRTLLGLPATQLGWRAARPPYSVLDTSRGRAMPALDTAIGRYLNEAATHVRLQAAA